MRSAKQRPDQRTARRTARDLEQDADGDGGFRDRAPDDVPVVGEPLRVLLEDEGEAGSSANRHDGTRRTGRPRKLATARCTTAATARTRQTPTSGCRSGEVRVSRPLEQERPLGRVGRDDAVGERVPRHLADDEDRDREPPRGALPHPGDAARAGRRLSRAAAPDRPTARRFRRIRSATAASATSAAATIGNGGDAAAPVRCSGRAGGDRQRPVLDRERRRGEGGRRMPRTASSWR